MCQGEITLTSLGFSRLMREKLSQKLLSDRVSNEQLSVGEEDGG